jgi:hypothetical protein
MNAHLRDNLSWVTRPVHANGEQVVITADNHEIDLLAGKAMIPGGYMGGKGTLRGVVTGDFQNATSGAVRITFRIKLGGATFWQDQSKDLDTFAARHDWMLKFKISNQTPTVQFCTGTFYYAYHGGATDGNGNLASTGTNAGGPLLIPYGSAGPVAIPTSADTTVDCPLVVSAQLNSNDPLVVLNKEWVGVELVGQGA